MARANRYAAALRALEQAQVRYVAARERFETAIADRRLADVPELRRAVAEAEYALRRSFDMALLAHRAYERVYCGGEPPAAPEAELVRGLH